MMSNIFKKLLNSKALPYLIMVLPPLFWAGNFVVGRAVVSDQVAPITLSFWRWLLAMLILLPFAINPMWQQREIIKKHFGKILFLAVLSISAFNSLAYIALQYTTATNATLLNSFIPIFILIISGIFFKEKISNKQIFGVLISLMGVFVILTRLDIEVIKSLTVNKGDLWMLVAALDWALYSIFLKYLRPKEISPLPFLGIMVIIGTIVLIPLLLINPFNEAPIIWNNGMLKAIAYIAIFPSIFAYLAWNYGMQKLGATTGGQFIHLMPLFGALMAVLFLGETIQLYHLLGGACIALGLWLSINLNSSSMR
jgi:drug/metabolite transporter (DMT)-like permease